MTKKPFLQKLLDSVASDAAGKAPAVAEAKTETTVAAPVVPVPRVADPFAEVRERMQAIQAAHAQAEGEARQAYLELLRCYAPARSSAAPAPDAHALAAPPTTPVPHMSDVLAVLSGVRKTPDDLARDVKTWTQLRDQADLVAQRPALQAAERAAEEAVRAARAEAEKIQKEWEAKIEELRVVAIRAASPRWAADEAAKAIEKAQGIDRELRAVKWTTIMDRARATAEELAAEQAERETRARLCERAVRLGALERVFFPPPPPPGRDPNVVQYEGCEWRYTPRDDAP